MEKLSKTNKNQRGMTLIEIMVSIVVGVIVLLGATSTIQQLLGAQASTDARQEVTQLMFEVNNILRSVTVCESKMVGIVGPTPATTNFVEVSLSPKIVAAQQYGTLRFSNVQLKNVQDLGGNNRVGDIEIVGNFAKKVLGPQDFVRRTKIYYRVPGAGNEQIIACIDTGSAEQDDCVAMGGIWNNGGNFCDFCASIGGQWSTGGVWSPGAVCNQNAGTGAACAATTSNNPYYYCEMPATPDAGIAGACAPNATGTCQATCVNGSWNLNSNSCHPSCAATTLNYCQLPLTPSGQIASGVGPNAGCIAGATGPCSYQCTDGVWSSAVDCRPDCLNSTVDNCKLPSAAAGTNKAGVCVNGATGACTFNCVGPTWGSGSPTCTPASPSVCNSTTDDPTWHCMAGNGDVGDVQDFSCDVGYTPGGANPCRLSCQAGGNWLKLTATSCVQACSVTNFAFNWTVGVDSCTSPNLSFSSKEGDLIAVSDTTAPSTGTGAFRCTSGAFVQDPSSTCAAPTPTPTPAPCTIAANKTWVISGVRCQNTTGALSVADGTSGSVQDTDSGAGQYTSGTGTFSCSAGLLSFQSGSSTCTCTYDTTMCTDCHAGCTGLVGAALGNCHLSCAHTQCCVPPVP